MNPLQILREIITKNNLTNDDILYRLRKKVGDAPMNIR